MGFDASAVGVAGRVCALARAHITGMKPSGLAAYSRAIGTALKGPEVLGGTSPLGKAVALVCERYAATLRALQQARGPHT